MSSEVAGKAAAPVEPEAGQAPDGAETGEDDASQPPDPWFAPGPKHTETETEAGLTEPDAGSDTAQWFLRAGRAGLLPDSMTVDWDADEPHPAQPAEAAGAPPWAGEATGAAAAPPPWETGPWPGPGGPRPRASARAGAGSAEPALRPASAGGRSSRWSTRTLLLAGLLPVVLVVVIVVIVLAVTAGPAAHCTGYPVAVRQAYAKVMTDLSKQPPISTVESDLSAAASLANSAAASAGQIKVRTGLFALADDLEQVRTDVTAGRPVPASLRQHLTADGSGPASTCSS